MLTRHKRVMITSKKGSVRKVTSKNESLRKMVTLKMVHFEIVDFENESVGRRSLLGPTLTSGLLQSDKWVTSRSFTSKNGLFEKWVTSKTIFLKNGSLAKRSLQRLVHFEKRSLQKIGQIVKSITSKTIGSQNGSIRKRPRKNSLRKSLTLKEGHFEKQLAIITFDSSFAIFNYRSNIDLESHWEILFLKQYRHH